MSAGRVHSAELYADNSRVVAQLFLPGEEVPATRSRAAEIVARVLALTPKATEQMAHRLKVHCAARHGDPAEMFLENAAVVSSRLVDPLDLSHAQQIVLGAAFTSEFAVEGAALCNPSAVEHPDQTGLAAGQMRVAMSVRSIGEGHISSIGFAEAIIGPGRTWAFEERARPLVRAAVAETDWSLAHFRAALEHEGIVDEISSAVLRRLPDKFTATDLETAIAALPTALRGRAGGHRHVDALRELTTSAYRAHFDAGSSLSQRVLMPASSAEHHGMEDARLTRFTGTDGTVEYRATYTAYDGSDIAPRLITSPDLSEFTIHRLAGDAAHNKGMALFPRLIGDSHYALSRTDGESTSLAKSHDGVIWTHVAKVHGPEEPWEMIQTGNCGSPIETEHGWIVLTHGVGPMRNYAMGALLLDLEDPGVVIARTTEPLLVPKGDLRDGYVPSVIYSCGGLLYEGVLWVPIGIGDARIGVYSIEVDKLIAGMTAYPRVD